MDELNKLKTELKIRGFSPLTVRNYSFFVEKFLAHAKKEPKKLTEDDAKAYISELFDSKSKNSLKLPYYSSVHEQTPTSTFKLSRSSNNLRDSPQFIFTPGWSHCCPVC